MTKKEMLQEMCKGATTSRASKELVAQFYEEFKRLESNNFVEVKSKGAWQNMAAYMLKAN